MRYLPFYRTHRTRMQSFLPEYSPFQNKFRHINSRLQSLDMYFNHIQPIKLWHKKDLYGGGVYGVLCQKYKPRRFFMKSSCFIFRSCLILALWRSVFSMMIANANSRTVSGFLKFFTWSGLQSMYRSAKTCIGNWNYQKILKYWADSADSDQTAVWTGSTSFAILQSLMDSEMYEPRHDKMCLWEFPTRPDTNRPAQT